MPQCIVWVVLEWHPSSWVPLGVLFPKAFLGICPESQFLTFTKLHEQNVCVGSLNYKRINDRRCYGKTQSNKGCNNPSSSHKLTILLNVVIGVIVSTPGSHLQRNNKAVDLFLCFHLLTTRKRQDSLGWLWGYWTKGLVRWHDVSGLQCIEHPKSIQQNILDRNRHRYSPGGSTVSTVIINENCYGPRTTPTSITDMHSLSSLHLPWNTAFCPQCHHLWEVWDLTTQKQGKSNSYHQVKQQAAHTCSDTYQPCVQWTHHAALKNLHQSGSSQWLQ